MPTKTAKIEIENQKEVQLDTLKEKPGELEAMSYETREVQEMREEVEALQVIELADDGGFAIIAPTESSRKALRGLAKASGYMVIDRFLGFQIKNHRKGFDISVQYRPPELISPRNTLDFRAIW